jgi:transcriptional regulator of acetoin/glycerol metabolism
MSNPQLVGLWAYDPKEAANRVKHALEAEKQSGSTFLINRTAARLGISRRTLFRWMKKPELKGVGP